MVDRTERRRISGFGESGRSLCSIDVVVLSAHGRSLTLLCMREQAARARHVLPFDVATAGVSLEKVARRVVHRHLRAAPTWIEQLGAFSDGQVHPAKLGLSVAYVAVLPGAPPPRPGAEWVSPSGALSLPARQRVMADAALSALRMRMDYAPIAFRLLPRLFTLTELQAVYELLLGRRLHKASFRRALLSASLVEATDQWRSDGRGRPAQFFRYAARRRNAGHHMVRFELLQ